MKFSRQSPVPAMVAMGGIRARTAPWSRVRSIRRWLRCLWYTQLLHELDMHTGRCRFCGRPLPPNETGQGL
ncbi:MAG TPA: hypothetical protein VMM93_00995 [Vicinamibacterales bacterium]|nr:hypothetical protein [Vicinamibacterales bacterium]